MEMGLEFLQFQAIWETDHALKLAVGQLREGAVPLAPLLGLLALSLDVELIALNSDFEIVLSYPWDNQAQIEMVFRPVGFHGCSEGPGNGGLTANRSARTKVFKQAIKRTPQIVENHSIEHSCTSF